MSSHRAVYHGKFSLSMAFRVWILLSVGGEKIKKKHGVSPGSNWTSTVALLLT